MAGDRPFRILGVQQVAVGADDRQRLRHLWVDLLGASIERSFRSEAENVEEDICRFADDPLAVEIDLMQPVDPRRKPDVRHPPLHHVGLWVDDLAAAFEWLSARGVRFAPGGIRAGATGHPACFIHPRAGDGFALCGEGVLIELVQAPASLLAARSAGG